MVGEELGLFDGLQLGFNVDVVDWLYFNAVGEILGLVDSNLFGFNVVNLLGSKVVSNTLGLLESVICYASVWAICKGPR